MAKKENFKAINERILADCNPDVVFYACNGAVIRNIYELASTIESLQDDAFSYHVNQEKNDFANWVNDILGDGQLAKKLKGIKNRKKYAETIRKRIKELESTKA
ncbi:MAG: hypothetical protein V1837_02185 [Candidatus Woesearchaeota archaeon]